ncbi:MAG: methyltransferase [Clostridia bacterium]|nr:methyltransferase [Clostridia bacterium]
MRIISGEFRGRKLEKLEGMDIRPTTDRVKESLFNILGSRLFDCTFLDLFAGTGGIGIEAYSRGAAKVVFIDESAKSIKVLKGNLEMLNLLDKVEVYNTDYINAINKLALDNRKFDIIFIDPPYLKGFAQNALVHIEQNKLLNEDAMIVIEHDLQDKMPENVGRFNMTRQKKYGNTMLSFYGLVQ